jgi:hypothetical protein
MGCHRLKGFIARHFVGQTSMQDAQTMHQNRSNSQVSSPGTTAILNTPVAE